MSAEAFTHLHCHTEFSMLDGLGTVDDYAEKAAALGQQHLAITDHGTMCGVPRFYHAARKAGVEPILGSEFYFVEDAAWRPAKGEKAPERCHVVILARGARGYEVLSQLSTETHRNFWYKPLLDKSMVEALGDDAQHLVCLSGCAASEISVAVLAGQMEVAAEKVLWWRECFPHFYMELQHHGTEFDRRLNDGLVWLARRYGIPHVVTNDPHYVVPEDAHHHDTLLAIQTASDKDDPERFRFDGSGYHLKSHNSMRRAFREYRPSLFRDGARRTQEVARLCHIRMPQWERRTWHIPRYPDTDDPNRMLRRLALTELKRRREDDPERYGSEYRERVMVELDAFDKAKIADFMLITRDLIQHAVEVGIPVGPGRGSVCGTLVGYLIGIHKIDPVRYNLMFERFLNVARPRMPDIDSDFGPTRRAEMFEYAAQKYGEENVVGVAAYQNMKYKAAFRSLAKSYGIDFVEGNRLSKLLPDMLADEGDIIEVPPEFEHAVVAKYPELWEDMVRFAGIKRAVSAHPAGVIIADPDDHIRTLVPEMYLASSKRMCGQYDLDAAEEMGLMKEDFLGLRTLETIEECLQLIEQRTGERLEPDSWWPDHEDRDDEVYSMLTRGETAGVFQMEGPTNTGGIKQIKPDCFEDIVSCTSLYRTGAISAGFPAIFLANRQSGDIEYAHPALEPILGATWGVVIYQEQVMEMGEKLAGFTMEQVDDIKEAIKHKRSTLMKSMKPRFVRGTMATLGTDRTTATRIWMMIEGYSGYGYNRSHAVAYTFLTYQTARLKCLYPEEFAVALLRTVPNTSKQHQAKRVLYLFDATSRGMKIRRPDVNESDVLAVPMDGGLRFGFSDLAGVGPAAARKLVEGRPRGGYTTVEQVEQAVRNQGVMAKLAQCGALRPLGLAGDKTMTEKLLGWQFGDPLREYRDDLEELLVLPADAEQDEDHPGECRLTGWITMVKDSTTKSGKPYKTIHLRWNGTLAWNVLLWSTTNRKVRYRGKTKPLWDLLRVGTVMDVIGKWEPQYENLSVAGASAITVHRVPHKPTMRAPTLATANTRGSGGTRAPARMLATAIETERFEDYRWLAVERHNIYLARQAGEPPPWTDDPLLGKYHFCNVYRELDKTSLVIHDLCRRVSHFPDLHYVMAVLGRHLNRADLLTALPRDWYVSMEQEDFERWLADYTLGSAAYKIHTPLGINRRDGIALMVYHQLERADELSARLLACSSMQEAHGVLEQITTMETSHSQGLGVAKNFRISGLTGYQVLLDLVQTGFWPDTFEDQWAFIGIGAVRGARLLTGVDLETTRKENMGGITQPLRDFGWSVLQDLTRRMQEDWPADWPAFDVHVGETMLCEYDKYVTKSGGHLHGRLYRTEKG